VIGCKGARGWDAIDTGAPIYLQDAGLRPLATARSVACHLDVDYGAHLMTSNKIRPNQCLKVFRKGLNFEPGGAIDVRWSGTQTSTDR
jgi:hypothetical protein